MKLASFSVINYRSITNARKIQTNNMTVLKCTLCQGHYEFFGSIPKFV